jgi:hypothetical protein
MRRLALALLLASPAYAQTYEPQLLPPTIIGAPTTMTPLNLGDDNAVRLDLGFEFPYWDQTFTSAWVSSNGTISFSTASNLCCDGMPLENAPRNTIYGFWTDLISFTGNPYYRRNDGSFLVGWYGTFEYGSNNQQTVEVSLFSGGDIQFNFGQLALRGHTATVGITGPEAGDNIQLFYGRDPQFMQNQSGLLRWIAPVAQIDCTVTPLEPSCPPQMVSPVDVVTSPVIATIQAAYVDEAPADQIELAAATVVEPEQEIGTAAAEEVTESVAEQVAEAIAAETTAAAVSVAAAEPQAERLSPEQVAALAASAPAQDSQQLMQEAPIFMALAGPTGQFGASVLSGGGFVAQGPSAAFSGGQGIEIASSGSNSASPSSVANTIEALNMSGGSFSVSNAMSQGTDQQGGQSNNPDAEKMEAMASVPGFSAYGQVSLQDRPDFYAVRDIYRNRRLRDANFEMYRMTQSNNAKWQEMTDVQYR